MPKGTPIEIDYNKIYSSKFDGDFIILGEIAQDKNNNRYVLIKWLNTGTVQEVSLSSVVKLSIRDRSVMRIDYSKIYDSNFGKFRIISKADSVNGHKMVNIQFIETGTITTVRYTDAKIGNVRDRYARTIFGVACIGNASSYHVAYNIWEGMISRCYNINSTSYPMYGAKGVTVCDKWKCFEYFLEDLPYIDGYDNWINYPGQYHLDKDYKQMGFPYHKKVYSLETCCFIPVADNTCIAIYEKNMRDNIPCKYIGVTRIAQNRYRACISINRSTINLGTYETEEIAAAAYNNAVKFYRNSEIILNDVDYIDPDTLETLKI